MNIVKNLAVSNNSNAYISIENMAVYNSTTAVPVASKIDLVYLFRATPASFIACFGITCRRSAYLPGVKLCLPVLTDSAKY
jgi:hypothetical protein